MNIKSWIIFIIIALIIVFIEVFLVFNPFTILVVIGILSYILTSSYAFLITGRIFYLKYSGKVPVKRGIISKLDFTKLKAMYA